MFDRLEDIDKDKIRKIIAIGWFWLFGIIAVLLVLPALLILMLPLLCIILAVVVSVLLIMPACLIYPGSSVTTKGGTHTWSWSWGDGFKVKRKTRTDEQMADRDITKKFQPWKKADVQEAQDGKIHVGGTFFEEEDDIDGDSKVS